MGTYSLNPLNLSAVQSLLAEKRAEKNRLVKRKGILMVSQYPIKTREDVEADLVQANDAYDEITAEINAMPPPVPNRLLLIQANLAATKLKLTISLSDDTGESVPEREYELQVIDFKLSQLEVYIAELVAKETELLG